MASLNQVKLSSNSGGVELAFIIFFFLEICGYRCLQYIGNSPKNYSLKLENLQTGEIIFKQTCKGISLTDNRYVNQDTMSQVTRMHLQRSKPPSELLKLKKIPQQRFRIKKDHTISVGGIEKNFLASESSKRFYNKKFSICSQQKQTLPYGYSFEENLKFELRLNQKDPYFESISPIDYSATVDSQLPMPKFPLGPICHGPVSKKNTYTI